MAMGEKRRFSVIWREYRDCEAVIEANSIEEAEAMIVDCLLYTSPSPRDGLLSRMPSSA